MENNSFMSGISITFEVEFKNKYLKGSVIKEIFSQLHLRMLLILYCLFARAMRKGILKWHKYYI